MSVLVGYNTRLVVLGMSGSAGAFHAKQMVEYGTNVVAGMTPGKGGAKVAGLEQVPMYDTVDEAVRLRGANAAVVGILGAALYNPVWTSAVLTPRDFALALGGFLLLTVWKAPSWIVVALLAGLCAAFR